MYLVKEETFDFDIFDRVMVFGLNIKDLKILKSFRDTDGQKLYNLKGTIEGYSVLVYSVPEREIRHAN